MTDPTQPKATIYEFTHEDVISILARHLALSQKGAFWLSYTTHEVRDDPLNRYNGSSEIIKFELKFEPAPIPSGDSNNSKFDEKLESAVIAILKKHANMTGGIIDTRVRQGK